MRTVGMGTGKKETSKDDAAGVKKENKKLMARVAELEKENEVLVARVSELEKEKSDPNAGEDKS